MPGLGPSLNEEEITLVLKLDPNLKKKETVLVHLLISVIHILSMHSLPSYAGKHLQGTLYYYYVLNIHR